MDYVESNISQGRDSHSGVIRCLSFNRTGSLLASGGDDCTVKIWDVKGGKLRFHIEGHSPVLSLVWSPDPHILVVGFEDNVIATVVITEELLEVHGIHLPETQRRRGYPIERLALNTHSTGSMGSTGCDIKLAAAGHQHVRIWNILEDTSYQWARGHELPKPFSNGTNDDLKTLVTGVDWIDYQKVLVSYMYHGLMCWDTEERVTLFTIPIPSNIGHMALSPDRLTVAIYNMSNGIDIWDIGKAERRQSCKMPKTKGQNFPLPVMFLHNGTAVAAGHMEGRVDVWNVKDGSLIEELGHSGEPVRAISSFHYHDAEDNCIRYVIATAAAHGASQHKIRFWEASSHSAQWDGSCGCNPSSLDPEALEGLDNTTPLPSLTRQQSTNTCTNCLLTSAGVFGIVVVAGLLGIR